LLAGGRRRTTSDGIRCCGSVHRGFLRAGRNARPGKQETPRAGAPGEAFRAEEAILSAAASPQDDRSCTLRASSAGSGLLVFRGEVGSCGGFGEQVAKGGDFSEAKESVNGPAMSSIVP
jgi:hypothetical protein